MTEEFRFNLGAKRTRLTDADLRQALESVSEAFGERYFTSTEYNKLPGKRPHSATIIKRSRSWKEALALIGVAGGRKRRYAPAELIDNLEAVWKELGYPPGKKQIARLGKRISEGPYKLHWGGVRGACEALAAFHEGRISRKHLLTGNAGRQVRKTIPDKDRSAVLKRDRYRCRMCGAAPSNDDSAVLEVDHIVAVARGGTNDTTNLQTLYRRCNQGKKDR